ncbi:lipid droplet-regulating VLDL assembly factor AUP1-like [Homalodisca vitripennis]|uniref:lipid droplet-regulating VLDL assembly factor AUP1-like n=1 Tax=Homalodisca vitripennis TaxID=197043 RepID=UPI001EEBE1C5|nr:lipid droplet-regulating VLDL assembly factor AUP1-like [Homalodisca vitripennis]
MTSPEIKDLFFKTRFVSGWHLLGVVFYSPIGLVLALLRVFISLQAYLLALLLLIPELSFIRGLVLRLIGLVLGIFVIEENPSQRDKSVKVLVANNVTVLDHIPVHLVTGCFSPSAWDVWPLCLKVFEGSQDKHTFSTNLRNHLSSCIAPLLLQPEETPTNGRVGLLRFSPWCATVAPTVQPVCLQPWRPLEITTSTVSASFTDLFMFLFSPSLLTQWFSPWCATVAPTVQPVCLQPWRPLEITTSIVSATFSTDLFMFLFFPTLITQFSPWCATVAPTVQPVCLQPWRPLEITTSTVSASFTDLFMFLFFPTLITHETKYTVCMLLRFSPWCATVAPTVQPVCLQPWRPLEITTSTVSATFSTDLFWFLFSPVTVFRIRYLPVVKRQEEESDEDMADRIAQSIAKELGLVSTKFTAKDKHEYKKRYVLELSRSSVTLGSQSAPRINYEMQRMASQVAEVLPYVPYDAIIRDLSRTRSVDLTISNVLEGTVRFTPLPPEQRASTSSSSRTQMSTTVSSEASCSFPRSAQDRMMTFVERKARLIEAARQRYMEKHGLVDKQ